MGSVGAELSPQEEEGRSQARSLPHAAPASAFAGSPPPLDTTTPLFPQALDHA